MEAKLERAFAQKTAGTDPAGKSAFAQVITEIINPNHLSYELVNLFLPTRSLSPGDSLVRRVRKGFPVR